MTATSLERRAPASAAAMLHASNLLTYASLLAGLSAIIAASWYQARSIAGMGMALIVVLDTFDGRFARRFVRTSAEREFGVQLDSLADAVNSGVVPVASLPAAFLMSVAGLAMISPVRISRPSGAGLFLFVLWPVVVFICHAIVLAA
jgi:phosphatidylserine synthase